MIINDDISVDGIVYNRQTDNFSFDGNEYTHDEIIDKMKYDYTKTLMHNGKISILIEGNQENVYVESFSAHFVIQDMYNNTIYWLESTYDTSSQKYYFVYKDEYLTLDEIKAYFDTLNDTEMGKKLTYTSYLNAYVNGIYIELKHLYPHTFKGTVTLNDTIVLDIVYHRDTYHYYYKGADNLTKAELMARIGEEYSYLLEDGDIHAVIKVNSTTKYTIFKTIFDVEVKINDDEIDGVTWDKTTGTFTYSGSSGLSESEFTTKLILDYTAKLLDGGTISMTYNETTKTISNPLIKCYLEYTTYKSYEDNLTCWKYNDYYFVVDDDTKGITTISGFNALVDYYYNSKNIMGVNEELFNLYTFDGTDLIQSTSVTWKDWTQCSIYEGRFNTYDRYHACYKEDGSDLYFKQRTTNKPSVEVTTATGYVSWYDEDYVVETKFPNDLGQYMAVELYDTNNNLIFSYLASQMGSVHGYYKNEKVIMEFIYFSYVAGAGGIILFKYNDSKKTRIYSYNEWVQYIKETKNISIDSIILYDTNDKKILKFPL